MTLKTDSQDTVDFVQGWTPILSRPRETKILFIRWSPEEKRRRDLYTESPEQSSTRPKFDYEAVNSAEISPSPIYISPEA